MCHIIPNLTTTKQPHHLQLEVINRGTFSKTYRSSLVVGTYFTYIYIRPWCTARKMSRLGWKLTFMPSNDTSDITLWFSSTYTLGRGMVHELAWSMNDCGVSVSQKTLLVHRHTTVRSRIIRIMSPITYRRLLFH